MEEADEIVAGWGAAGEVNPAGTKTGVDAEDDGPAKAGTPLLGDESAGSDIGDGMQEGATGKAAVERR